MVEEFNVRDIHEYEGDDKCHCCRPVLDAENLSAAEYAIDVANNIERQEKEIQAIENGGEYFDENGNKHVVDYEDSRKGIEESREEAEADRNDSEESRRVAEGSNNPDSPYYAIGRCATERGREAQELKREIAEGSDDPSSQFYNEGRCANERDRIKAENTRNQHEEDRKKQEEERWTKYHDAEDDRYVEYKKAEDSRGEKYSDAETARGTAYTNAEKERDSQYDDAESARNKYYSTAEGKRNDKYVAEEGTRNSQYSSAEERRGKDYKYSESSRDSQYDKAETSRESQYSSAESGRDTRYESAESSRDVQYQNAESGRETRYEEAETARNNEMRQHVDKAIDNANTAARAANDAAAHAETAAGTIDSKVGDLTSKVTDFQRDFGQYVALPSVTLAAVQSGKRITKDGEFVADSAWNVGRLGAVSVGNTYELKMGDASKMVLGTALFVAHTIEKRGTADVDVYTPLFSAMTADIPASGYVCFEAMEAYEDVLVCYRTDVDGANTMLVRRYGTKASIATQINNLKKKVDLKSFADGYYEGMRVGTADNLTPRGTASEEVITDRKTGGTHSIEDGDAVIQRIKGRTLKVAQMLGSINNNGCTRTLDGDVWHVTQSSSGSRLYRDINVIEGHVYIQSVEIRSIDGGNVGFQNYGGGISSIVSKTSSSSFTRLAAYKKATSSVSTRVALYSLGDANGVYEYMDGSFNLFDLTDMFGAGNEPESVQAFADALGYDDISQVPYFGYTEGRLIPSYVEGVRTTWTNEDGTEGMFERKWTETIRRYFPDGMKSARNVYDEITPTKAIKRVGVVDLGTLTWTIHSSCAFRSRDLVNTIKGPTTTSVPGELLCSYYPNRSSAVIINQNDSYGITVNTQANIYVRDSAYTDAESFKAAMAGVMLYYTFAEPEEYVYDELNLTERVIEGGREMAIVAEGVESAPLVADIVYPIDAYNTIVANRENIGSMASLTTTAKQSLVAAINEINAKVSAIAALAAQSEGGEL